MANETLKELKYNGKKVISEVARRDALGRTINTTYATKSDIISEKIDINLADVKEISLDITGYSQLWLEIVGNNIQSGVNLRIGTVFNSGAKSEVLFIPVVELNGMFHAMVCITKRNYTFFTAYYNSSTNALQFNGDYAAFSNTIYFKADGISSSNLLRVIGFAILE